MRRFVSQPLVPAGEGFVTAPSGNEPPVPRAFVWKGRTLVISSVLRAWRSTKTDRGDAYLKRHWFELEAGDGAKVEVYYDREARHGASQWWLYAIEESDR
jgi:Family of unknown function (DUF6504)